MNDNNGDEVNNYKQKDYEEESNTDSTDSDAVLNPKHYSALSSEDNHCLKNTMSWSN